MPKMIQATVTGLPGVLEKLRAAGPKLAAKAMRKGLRAGGKVLREAVAERTPVKTGLLRENIKLRVSVSEKKMRGRASVGFGKQGYIARFVELGHRQVSHKPEKKEIGHVPAHPFMRPAFDSSVKKATEVFGTVVRASLPAVAAPGSSGSDEGGGE